MAHTYEWVVSTDGVKHANDGISHLNIGVKTYKYMCNKYMYMIVDMSASASMSHVANVNQSWHTYEWVMSNI